MRRVVAFALAVLLGVISPALSQAQVNPQPGPFDGHKVVRVHPRSVREMRTVLGLTDDVWTCGFGGDASSPDLRAAEIDVRLAPAALAALKGTQIPFDVLIENVQSLIDTEQPPFGARGPGFFTAYQDYPSVSAYVDTLVALNPAMASRVSVGTSLESRSIFAIRVSAPGAAAGSKPAIIVNCCQHAREWISVMAGMYLADQLVRNYATDANLHRLLDNYEFYIIPISNPDGYVFTWTGGNNRLWRKNRRPNPNGTVGVDLNRNWDSGFGGPGSSNDMGNDTYHGDHAFSEPCTAAISAFIQARPNTVLTFDLHSYSQIILEPNGSTPNLPRDTRAYTQISAVMQSAMYAPAAQVYTAGETYRIIYPAAGGAHEWAASATGVLGYSFELRDRGSSGFLLPSTQIVPASVEAVAGITSGANWVLDNAVAAWFPSGGGGAAGRPAWVPANSSTSIQVQFARGLKPLGDPATHIPTAYARVGRIGPFTPTLLTSAGTDEGGPVFTHALPSGPCSGTTQWYYQVPLLDGSTATVPPAGAAAPFQASARTATTILSDTFEGQTTTWSVGDTTFGSADTATSGLWIRADPNGTTSQAEYDCTPLGGTTCFITGQNPQGNPDSGRLSAGKTTLFSPIFSAAGATKLDVSFWLWTFTSQTEPFIVDVTSNATAAPPTWTRVLSITPTSAIGQTTGRWLRYTIRLSDFVTPGASMRMRFVASAASSAVVVEAALDDVSIVSFPCDKAVCPGDFNWDGTVNVADIFAYLTLWFASDPAANVNGGALDVSDIFAFLSSWFGACP